MTTRSVSTGGGTGRQLGKVFLATCVIGAVLGGTISYMTSAGTEPTPNAAVNSVAGASPEMMPMASAAPDADQMAPVAEVSAAPVAAGAAPAPAQEDPAAPAAAVAENPAAASPGTGNATQVPASPAPVSSTRRPSPVPTTTSPEPAVTSQSASPAPSASADPPRQQR